MTVIVRANPVLHRPTGLAALFRRPPDIVLSIATPLVLLAFWELAVRVNWLDYRFFPAPSQIAIAGRRLLYSGELLVDIEATMLRIVVGFAIGATAGIAAGLALGGIRLLRVMFEPILNGLYVIPKISILPLIMIIFGLGEGSKIAIVALGSFFVVAINTIGGVRTVDPILLDAGRNFGASGFQMFRHVLLPATMPHIFTGLKIGAGVALLVVIAAEFVAADAGVGYLIWRSWTTLVTEQMYVGFLVIAMLGIAFAWGLSRLSAILMPWLNDAVDVFGSYDRAH